MRDQATKTTFLPKRLALVVATLLVALRLWHLSAPIDEPHSWRQADTANYALDLYRHGLNPFKPEVCWQGASSQLILEFPAYEWVVALLYKVTGERLPVARLVAIAAWGTSLAFLIALVSVLCSRSLALTAAVVYASLPLGIYYSRAVHTDFAALAAALAMAYFWIVGVDRHSRRQLLVGSLCGALAFLIKIPYAFCLLFPVATFVLRPEHRRFALSQLPMFAIPLVAFAPWWWYVERVNASAPDYDFLPGYFKFVHMGHWYFGPVAQRLEAANWWMLAMRICVEVTTALGALLGAIGLVSIARRRLSERRAETAFVMSWIFGVVVYLLIFFNLNLNHDYYQIPFLPIAAVVIASGVCWLGAVARRPYVVPALLIALAVSGVRTAVRNYYGTDAPRDWAGEQIRQRTSEGDLVVAAAPDADPRDPRLLYRAHRHGFSVKNLDLSVELLQAARRRGASFVAMLISSAAPIPDEFRRYLGAAAQELSDPRASGWKLLVAPLPPS